MRSEGVGETVMGTVKIEAMWAGPNQHITHRSIYFLYRVSFQSKSIKEPKSATARNSQLCA